MAPLTRKHPRDEATAAPAPAAEATTTRRATRQTSTAPLPMQLDPEPRKRRRRANSNEEEEAPAPPKPSKSTRRTSPGTRGKENIPAIETTKSGPLKQARQPTRIGGALTAAPTTSASVKAGLKPTPLTQPVAKQAVFSPHNLRLPPHADTAKQPQPIQPRRQPGGTAKPATTALPGPQSQHKPALSHSPSSASPANPRGATIPSTDRNIDKVVLGDICFRAWYPSYYGKDVLGDFSSPSTSTHPSHHPPAGASSKASSEDGAKGHARHRDPPPILDRLCVCPCCFKYSKELVSWWEHVRICETRAHVPGRKIYVHPKGQRTVLVPAPGTAASRPGKGGKRGSVSAKMVEQVVKDEGEWSIWEVDGEKEGVSLLSTNCFPIRCVRSSFADNGRVLNHSSSARTSPCSPSSSSTTNPFSST